MDPSIDYYKILGISQNSSKVEVRSAYLKLAKIWHPDLHRDEKAKVKARTKFIEIGAAYEILHDNGQRKKYDDYRRYGHTQQPYEQKSNPFNTNQSMKEWDRAFKYSMDEEWDRIRKEQTDWAKTRGKDYQRSYHYSSEEDPFEAFRQRRRPWDPNLRQGQNPGQNLIRTLMQIFFFLMLFRALTIILFGRRRRRDDWRRGPPPNSPYNRMDDVTKDGFESNSERSLRRDRGIYPSNRTSLRKNEYERDEIKDNKENNMKFSTPAMKGKRNAYEQHLADQRMIHNLYTKAQNKEKDERRRKREFDEKFHGRRKERVRNIEVENKNSVNEDWEDYMNKNSSSNSNSTKWRD